MQPIIATLILMVAGRGIAQLITGGQIVTIYYEPFFFFGNGFFLGIPFAIYLVAVVAAVLLLLVHKTALGLFIQAVGLNPTAARFSGISARALIFWVYGFCGVTAAVAGVIIASNVKSADGNNAGLMMELDAILAVALGGTLLDGGRFSLVGTLIGAPDSANALVCDLFAGRAAGNQPRGQGDCRVRRLSDPVGGLAQNALPASDSSGGPGMNFASLVNPRSLPLIITSSLFALLYGFGAVSYDAFLSPQVFINLLIDNGFLLVVAVGMTFVIISGGIDLSVGSIVALTTMISATLAQQYHWNFWQILPLVLAVGCLLGLFMGILIQIFKLQPFIVTLGGMFLARGLCYVISIDSISITEPSFTALSEYRMSLGEETFISTGALIAVVILLIGIYVAHFTRFGRTVYAIGGNERSAMLMGAAGRAHEDHGLCAQRLLLFARRRARHALHAVGLRAARAGDGTRRDRGGGDRRHAADRRRRLPSPVHSSAS